MASLTRRQFLPLSLAAGAAPARRPNVVLLLTDDQRFDTLHALGNPVCQTPHLDSLVRAGVTFPNAYCMGGHVGAVCLPSRMMIQRGVSWFTALRQQQPTPNLAATFNDAGYVTYQFTKKGNTDHAAQRSYQSSDSPLPDDQAERNSGQPGRQMADRAIAFLERWKGDRSKPFLMYLAGASPHDPRVAAPEYLARYDAARIPLPRNFRPLHTLNNGELKVRDEQLAPWPRTPEAIREHLREYYAVVTQMDEQIGRILRAVRDAGEEANTYFVFTCDQGIALGSHGLMGKQNLYEHSMRAGLTIAGPGVLKNRRVEDFAYLFDIYPTLCELAGIAVPASLEGRSLARTLRGEKGHGREAIFLGYRDVQRAVRQGRWKLIVYPKINRQQLFDLQQDPDEINDLSASPTHAAKVKELRALMAAQQRQWGDQAPLESATPAPAEVDISFFR
jgi:arylsulfatase A-like enzyme